MLPRALPPQLSVSLHGLLHVYVVKSPPQLIACGSVPTSATRNAWHIFLFFSYLTDAPLRHTISVSLSRRLNRSATEPRSWQSLSFRHRNTNRPQDRNGTPPECASSLHREAGPHRLPHPNGDAQPDLASTISDDSRPTQGQRRNSKALLQERDRPAQPVQVPVPPSPGSSC